MLKCVCDVIAARSVNPLTLMEVKVDFARIRDHSLYKKSPELNNNVDFGDGSINLFVFFGAAILL